ncbi:LysR family transcriptional regulator [Tateyamaria omphalii]|uniref:LysR family transcriptional regulator n=1 Tax=Tateyamaria omphalii TaxID=299262 RepID=UPI001675D4B6|nr:LysR family transcriptional regulator [Tateyamaria omphalii]GGX63616.1 LysR family transcriptional regulator [Tateyamaria omphalii]
MASKTKLHLARTLIAAVEGGSIASGARALNITRSAASKNIALLEDALGTKLLNRSSRSLSLTHAGEVYIQEVQKALRMIDAAESAVSQYREEPTGVLTIDSTILFGRMVLGDVIHDYLKKNPKMTVDLRLNDDASNVTSGEIDLYFRTGRPTHQDLIAIKLMDICFRTVASREYILNHTAPHSIAALADHNCINFRFPSDHSIFQWRYKLGNETAYQVFGGNLISTDVEEIRKAVHRGLGIAQLPNQLIDDDIQLGRLVDLFPENTFVSNALYMCIPRHRRADIRVTRFRAALRSHLG